MQTDGVSLFDQLAGPSLAVDAAGNAIWYCNMNPNVMSTAVPGGTYPQIDGPQNALREVDLIGNTLKTTIVERINDQLTLLGRPTIVQFHHDVPKLPNGNYVFLGLEKDSE